VRDPIETGGALKDVIEAPSLDVVRQLDARTNIGFAVEPAAAADSEPDVHEDSSPNCYPRARSTR
jgi:hypothetical protein